MEAKYTSEKTIELAKYFSWLSFSLIIIASVFLATFFVRSTLTSSVEAQEDYLLLLAEDFNRQLFRRFTIPIVLAEDNISLRNKDQYRLLNETVENMISGLNVEGVRIFDEVGEVVYSINELETQEKLLDANLAKGFFDGAIPYLFLEENKISYFKAFFSKELDPGTFILQILFPLSVDRDLVDYFNDNSVLGLLQLNVDVSSQYLDAVNLQRYIIIIFIASSLILFLLLQYTARKAGVVISERIQKNKELESQLLQQEKLAGMGRMVASIAHEIRNPLGIIRSSSELLKSRNKDNFDNASQRILDAMSDEIGRLSNIVNDFLDYARPREPRKDEVNMAYCLTKTITFLENKIKSEEILLDLNMDESINIKGEEDLLYRALYNIISNAIQALEDKNNKILRIILYKDRSEVIIEIADNGDGFSEVSLNRVLDPFYTTKESGTGLGLPIANSIIEAHGGKMRAYNNDMGGASIEIKLKS